MFEFEISPNNKNLFKSPFRETSQWININFLVYGKKIKKSRRIHKIIYFLSDDPRWWLAINFYLYYSDVHEDRRYSVIIAETLHHRSRNKNPQDLQLLRSCKFSPTLYHANTSLHYPRFGLKSQVRSLLLVNFFLHFLDAAGARINFTSPFLTSAFCKAAIIFLRFN
jgi:hypothetical protein